MSAAHHEKVGVRCAHLVVGFIRDNKNLRDPIELHNLPRHTFRIRSGKERSNITSELSCGGDDRKGLRQNFSSFVFKDSKSAYT